MFAGRFVSKKDSVREPGAWQRHGLQCKQGVILFRGSVKFCSKHARGNHTESASRYHLFIPLNIIKTSIINRQNLVKQKLLVTAKAVLIRVGLIRECKSHLGTTHLHLYVCAYLCCTGD